MRRFASLALAALVTTPAAWAFTDQHANDLIMKTLKTSNILTKAAIGELLFEGLLQPRPGKLADIVSSDGGLKSKAAWLYLKTMKIVPGDYGSDTPAPPAGNDKHVHSKVEVPEGVDAKTVTAWVSGWGLHYGPGPSTKLEADGTLKIETGLKKPAMVVVRSPQCDIAYGGDETRIMPRRSGTPFSPLEKSRMVLQPGHNELGFLFPFSGTTDWGFPNLQGPKAVKLLKKTAGKAKFVYFSENSPMLTKSLVDPDQPMGRVEVIGDWNNWSTDANTGTIKELFDDGGMVEDGSQDAVVGDSVYTRVLDLPKGTYGYAFLVNGAPNPQRDPYEEGNKIVKIKTQLGKFDIRVSTITVE